MLQNSILLSGQIGDTIKCYNADELRKIAHGLVKRRECDTILTTAYNQISSLHTVISLKDSIILNKDNAITIKDNQGIILKDRISVLEDQNQKLKKSRVVIVGVALLTIILGFSL